VSEPWTTPRLVAALEATYEPDEGKSREWATIFEATLADNRRVDCLALNLWQSRGHTLRGHEIKASRADWLVELKDPEKSARAVTSCDEWYIVAAPAVVLTSELPTGWGLMLPARKRLKIAHPAVLRVGTPGRELWARLIQKSFGLIHQARVEGHAEGLKEGRDTSGHDAIRQDRSDAYDRLQALQEAQEDVLMKLGVGTWNELAILLKPPVGTLIRAAVEDARWGPKCGDRLRRLIADLFASSEERTRELHELRERIETRFPPEEKKPE